HREGGGRVRDLPGVVSGSRRVPHHLPRHAPRQGHPRPRDVPRRDQVRATLNGWGPPALWASGVLVACLLLVPVEARAAGCCGSQLATADRLSPDEWRSVSLAGSFASVTGGFDASA